MIKKTFSIILIILGVIGLFLPIISGIALIVAGLILLELINKKFYKNEKSRIIQKREKA